MSYNSKNKNQDVLLKNALLIIVIIIFSAPLYSAEPLVRFYLQDGSTKQYNLSEIDNIKFTTAPDTLQLQIFKNDGKSLYYPAQLIDSIKLAIDYANENRLHIWHDGFIWDVAIHEIDSILLYYTTFTAVTIGTQHWMYKNLNVDHYRNGDSIPEVTDATAWTSLTTGAWCYYNNDSVIGAIYGKLYNWYAVTDPRGLAPSGWHVPSHAEWTELETCLGGTIVAGCKLKSTGTIGAGDGLWYAPNIGATNETGFTGLPAGCRSYGGTDNDMGIYAYWWSSTESSAAFAWGRSLCYIDPNISRRYDYNGHGHSVRCVKDE